MKEKENLKVEEMLLKKGYSYELKKKQVAILNSEKSLRECTFQPCLISE